jgi:hypothetical protein
VEAEGLELRIGEARRGDRAVDLHVAHAVDEVGAGSEVEVELDRREELLQAIDLGEDPGETELVARAEHDVHRRERAGGVHRAGALLHAGERATRGGEERKSGGREAHAPGRSDEELGAELIFELLDALPEGRRSERDRPRGRAEVEELGGRSKAPKRLDRREAHGRQRTTKSV